MAETGGATAVKNSVWAWRNNPEMAKVFAQVPNTVDAFMEKANKYLITEENATVKRSFDLLYYHGEIMKRLAEALYEGAMGNREECDKKVCFWCKVIRKIEKLQPFGVKITVVSPAFCSEIEGMTDILRIQRKFHPADIEGKLFLIGATDDEAVNQEIADLCRERNIPVNIVDDPKNCTFFFPALVKKGEFVAGFSTGGGSPLAAQYIRKQVEDAVPEGFDRVVEVLASVREQVKAEIPDIRKRETIFKELFALAL